MYDNTKLNSAKREKSDEFYTQLADIEKELYYYKDHFKDKVVLCNCNDALHSNFAKYFSLQFEFLGLKKLICTAYKVDGVHGKVAIYNGDKNGNGVPDIEEWEQYMLEGDGSFDSDECIEFLKEADVVVTNPPFSLFRSFMKLLIDYDKKFLIIGNLNALKYKDVFPLFKENKVRYGESIHSGDREFGIPDNYPITAAAGGRIDEKGRKFVRVKGVRWFTNIDYGTRQQPMELMTMSDNLKYSKHKDLKEKHAYEKYDNYDAIEVPYADAIPSDYDGVMGVPISFLDKHCVEQFEIVGMLNTGSGVYDYDKAMLNNKQLYTRILIRRK